MNELTVEYIYEVFKLKAEKEKNTNQETIKVRDLAKEVLRLKGQAYAKADELVFEDIIKLLDKRVDELYELLETI